MFQIKQYAYCLVKKSALSSTATEASILTPVERKALDDFFLLAAAAAVASAALLELESELESVPLVLVLPLVEPSVL